LCIRVIFIWSAIRPSCLQRELSTLCLVLVLQSGKQIVYHALQDPADDATPEALAAIEDGIKQLQDELAAHKASEKSLRGELAMLCSKVPISELRQEVSRLEAERAETLGRLAKLRNDDDGALVSAEQRAQVEREWKEWRKHVHVRKKICRDLWERCTEVLPEDTTKEDLWVRADGPRCSFACVLTMSIGVVGA